MPLSITEITKRIEARLKLDKDQSWDLQQALNLAYNSGLSEGKKQALTTVENMVHNLKEQIKD